MANGEGIPLPDTLDKQDPAIMQLARRNSVTPGEKNCRYNELILTDLDKGQYGCVGQGLNIVKALRTHLPEHVRILLVPCCMGEFCIHSERVRIFSPDSGTCNKASLWGSNTPLYMDLISRTKAALDLNSRNILVGVSWQPGEFYLSSLQYDKQPSLFNEMAVAFRDDISSHHAQCINFSEKCVP